MTSKERLEQLGKQYQEVSQKANEYNTLKLKLEGAIEYQQAIIAEEEEAAKAKEADKKEKK